MQRFAHGQACATIRRYLFFSGGKDGDVPIMLRKVDSVRAKAPLATSVRADMDMLSVMVCFFSFLEKMCAKKKKIRQKTKLLAESMAS